MARSDEVPDAYRRFFYVNAGGPLTKIVSRQVVDKKWQLVTLECGDKVLLPMYQRAAKVGCGCCGGLETLPEQSQ
jgi:hypothetical protein